MIQAFVMYGISTLSIVFGLVALLKQKTYIDSETQQPTEIEVPLLGKLKTNYPALVFVVLGIAMAHLTFERAYPVPGTQWKVKGKFEHPDGEQIDWRLGNLAPFPVDFEASIYPNGAFEIDATVKDGKSLEEYFEILAFNHPEVSASIVLKDEHEGFKTGGESLIKATTKSTWTFKPIPVETWMEER